MVEKLKEATESTMKKPNLLSNGFRRAGICPWNPSAVDTEKLRPATDFSSGDVHGEHVEPMQEDNSPGEPSLVDNSPGGSSHVDNSPGGSFLVDNSPGGFSHVGNSPGGSSHVVNRPGGSSHVDNSPGGSSHVDVSSGVGVSSSQIITLQKLFFLE